MWISGWGCMMTMIMIIIMCPAGMSRLVMTRWWCHNHQMPTRDNWAANSNISDHIKQSTLRLSETISVVSTHRTMFLPMGLITGRMSSIYLSWAIHHASVNTGMIPAITCSLAPSHIHHFFISYRADHRFVVTQSAIFPISGTQLNINRDKNMINKSK